jgi:hypothetical protein
MLVGYTPTSTADQIAGLDAQAREPFSTRPASLTPDKQGYRRRDVG